MITVLSATWNDEGLACGTHGRHNRLCLLFIHPGASNLISLRSAGTIPA